MIERFERHLGPTLEFHVDEQGYAIFHEPGVTGRHCRLEPSELEALCRFLGGGNGVTLANQIQDMRMGIVREE